MTFALLVFLITSVVMSAQTPNPPYLSEMPSVDRVMREETRDTGPEVKHGGSQDFRDHHDTAVEIRHSRRA
jgi:hypothetical protein